MKKFKVEFIQSSTYVIDVEAKDEEEAKDKAQKRFSEEERQGTLHYFETGYEADENSLKIGTIYDVTDTDDPFDP